MFSPRSLRILAACLLVAALPSLACSSDDSSPDTEPDPAPCGGDLAGETGIVLTDLGPVRGQDEGDVAVYLGIPFAQPPLGDLRWRAPERPACWSEPLEAVDHGPACTQIDLEGNVAGDEDCLRLDVYAPKDARNLPVLFFIHGGDNIIGTKNDYDGRNLARAGAVVVVANYRLNAFGWLAHPAFAGENEHGATGNYALLDQIAALGWVGENVAAFGGNPERVLVFGQSAGANNTCALIASPLANGLFSAAMMESGNCTATPAARVEATLDSTEQALGCDGATDPAGCLRAKTAAEVVGVPGAGSSDLAIDADFYPSVDGWVLPESPDAAIRRGAHNHVPLVIGTTEDEYLNVLEFFLPEPIVTEADYEAAVEGLFGAGASLVLSVYPASAYPTPRNAMAAIMGDLAQHCPSRRALRDAAGSQTEPVRRFLFGYDFVSGPLAPYGAAHGHDVAFFWKDFDFLSYSPTPAEAALADAMMSYLVRFAATGDPNGEGAHDWPAYDAASDPYIVLDDPIAAGAGFRSAECDFWDQLLE